LICFRKAASKAVFNFCKGKNIKNSTLLNALQAISPQRNLFNGEKQYKTPEKIIIK